MRELKTIQGAWSDEANGWVSEDLELTCDTWLEVTLPHKGRLVIKKSETPEGPWPKAVITPWAGPKFLFRLFIGRDDVDSKGVNIGHSRYIRIITTVTPTTIYYADIQKRRTSES